MLRVEGDFRKRKGQMDISQLGNWECFRNAYFLAERNGVREPFEADSSHPHSHV